MSDHDMELGPAGKTDTRRAMETISPGNAPQPSKESPTKAILEVAGKIPGIVGTVTEGIKTATAIYEALKATPTEKGHDGEGGPLPAYMKKSLTTDLDDVLRYKMAEILTQTLFDIGDRAGIDFRKWTNGAPPKTPGAAPAQPQASPAPTATPPTATPAAPTQAGAGPAQQPAQQAPPPKEGEEDPMVKSLLAELNKLTLDYLKGQATQWFERLIESSTKLGVGEGGGGGPFNQWHWNGAGEAFWGPQPEVNDMDMFHDDDHDGRTSSTLSWSFNIVQIPDGVLAGFPDAIAHFTKVPAPARPVRGLGWYTGGQWTSRPTKAHGDDIHVSATAKENPNVGMWGGYHMAYTFKWDEADTHMFCDVAVFPPDSILSVNIKTDGTPKT